MTPQVEITTRLAVFAGVLLSLAICELVAPRRQLAARKGPRWASNLALVVMNTLLARLAVPVTAVSAAMFCERQGWGLLHLVSAPPWLEFLMALVALDFAIWLQHVVFHHVPLLWRLHLVHHADLDFDVTTGLRFHTLEIILSALIKLAVVALLGPSALAVVTFEIVLNVTSMFSHSNIRLPLPIDRVLRWILVTPDMHRVHHSVRRAETDSNFGFNLPWWDRLFRTYQDQPADRHETMTIGLAHMRDERQVDRLPGMLILPLRPSTAAADASSATVPNA